MICPPTECKISINEQYKRPYLGRDKVSTKLTITNIYQSNMATSETINLHVI